MDLSAAFTRSLLNGFQSAYAELLRAATRSTGSRDEARDLVHDTWVRLAEHAGTAGQADVDPGIGADDADRPRDVAAYLAVMARHLALDGYRRDQRLARHVDAATVAEQLAPRQAPDVADAVMYRQCLQVLEETLASLPERTRQVFLDHRVHGDRQPEIATRLGVSVNTVERDLIQAGDCIEDALRRWRGGSGETGGSGCQGIAGLHDLHRPHHRQAASPGPVDRAGSARRPGRRRNLAALLGLAGLGAGGTLAWRQWQQWRDTHVQWMASWHSPRGRQTRQSLPDGSVLLLDALSRAEGRYFATRREVHLIEGAGFFEVAHDADRPFTVQAGRVRVIVLGTRFGVELTPLAGGGERVAVQVESGRVRVESLDGLPAQDLGAGDSLRLEGAVAAVTSVTPAEAAAWRHGELVFTDATLGEALERLSRYTTTALVATPEAAALPLNGRVRVAQASAWLAALPRAMPVRLQPNPAGDGLQVTLAK